MSITSLHTEELSIGINVSQKQEVAHPQARQENINHLNPSTKEPEKLSASIADNPDHQRRLTSLLLICFDTLDTFGKEPEQLTNLQSSFLMVLGRFTIENVESAFRIYMEHQAVMPKPADIVKIIEPPVQERKWCATSFIPFLIRPFLFSACISHA